LSHHGTDSPDIDRTVIDYGQILLAQPCFVSETSAVVLFRQKSFVLNAKGANLRETAKGVPAIQLPGTSVSVEYVRQCESSTPDRLSYLELGRHDG
jgi:hypothetical protein